MSTWQRLKDCLLFPVRATQLDTRMPWLGLTSLQDERTAACLPHCTGRLLDIGCGSNVLVERFGSGIGVDVYPWSGIDILCDTRRLPFADTSFDTVAFVACLNHIPAREQVLADARRVLRPGGRVVVTMIDPTIGLLAHKTFQLLGTDPDCCQRGMAPGEHWGLWPSTVEQLLNQAGFRVQLHRRFLYGLNHLFVAS